MTAFKTLATLILVGILVVALTTGPSPTRGDKGSPGPQSPPELRAPDDGPPAILVFLTLVVMPLVGLAKRITGSGYIGS